MFILTLEHMIFLETFSLPKGYLTQHFTKRVQSLLNPQFRFKWRLQNSNKKYRCVPTLFWALVISCNPHTTCFIGEHHIKLRFKFRSRGPGSPGMVSLLCRQSLLPALGSQKTGTPGDIKTLSFMFAENMLCVGYCTLWLMELFQKVGILFNSWGHWNTEKEHDGVQSYRLIHSCKTSAKDLGFRNTFCVPFVLI